MPYIPTQIFVRADSSFIAFEDKYIACIKSYEAHKKSQINKSEPVTDQIVMTFEHTFTSI